MIKRALLVAGLFACSGPAPKPPPANAVTTPPPADAAEEEEEPTECVRYRQLRDKADACTALSEEIRQDLQQWETDMMASISESGMEGSSPVDEEKLCGEAADHILKVAKQPCGL